MRKIVRCDECKRETYGGQPWCPHCWSVLPQPWLVPADGGYVEIVQNVARYRRKSFWRRERAWEEPLSQFDGLRIHQVEIRYDDGGREVLFHVELVHPSEIRNFALSRDIIGDEEAEVKLAKCCKLLGLKALSKIHTSKFSYRSGGGFGVGGFGGGGNGGGGNGGGGGG